MRRAASYVAGLAALTVALTAAPASADRQVLPTSTGTVVPWRSIAPRPEPTVPLPPRVTTRCTAGAISVVATRAGIWHGSMVTVTLRATGAACLVPHVAGVEGRRPDGSRLRLQVTSGDPMSDPPLRPSAGRDGEVDLTLAMPYCTRKDGSTYPADPQREVTHAHIILRSGQVIALPGEALNESCGLSVGLTRPYGDLDTTTVPRVDLLAGWGDLRADGPLPLTLVRGTTAAFDVTLRNVTRRPFSLAVCPNWTITFVPFKTKGQVLYRAHGRLNCADAPATIPPFGSVTFAMRYRVPLRASSGVAGFSWTLDQTNAWAHSNNPTTGDALVT
jgi:hypothetical protein